MCHPSDSHNSDNYRGLWPSLWLFWKWFLPRPLQLQEILAMLRVGADRCFSLCWFPKISRGGHGEHFLCPDDPATGEPEVFDLVFDGCNYQVWPSMTRQGKKSGTLIQISSCEKTKSRFSKTHIKFVILPLPGVNWLWRSANLRSVRRGLWVDKFSYLEHFTIRWNGTFCRRDW